MRLEIEEGGPPEIAEQLVTNFELEPSLVFRVRGMVNLQRLFHLYEETPRPDLKYAPFAGRQVHIGHDADTMFAALRQNDVLLHHPYESYDAVVAFLETAARDPRVLSMKQTLYRTNTESPIARALLEAASRKEVTVVVELKASFDEASNIRWARSFEDAEPELAGHYQTYRGDSRLEWEHARHASYAAWQRRHAEFHLANSNVSGRLLS